MKEKHLKIAMQIWRQISQKEDLGENNFERVFNSDITQSVIIGVFKELSKKYPFFKNVEFQGFDKTDLADAMRYAKQEKEPQILEKPLFNDNFIDLVWYFLGLKDGDELYVPFARDLSFAKNTNISYFCDGNIPEIEVQAFKYLTNIKIDFKEGDALKMPLFREPEHKIKEFKNVLAALFLTTQKSKETKENKILLKQFSCEDSQNELLLSIDHIMQSFSNKAMIVIPTGFGFRGKGESFRKFIIDNNYLETIISLPMGFWRDNGKMIQTQVLVLNKHKNNENVMIVRLDENRSLKSPSKSIEFMKFMTTFEEKNEIQFAKKEQFTIADLKKNHYSLIADTYFNQNDIKNIKNKIQAVEYEKLEFCAHLVRSQAFSEAKSGVIIKEISHADFPEAGYLDLSKITRTKCIGDQEKKLENYKIEPFDILLNARGTIGLSTIVPDFSNSQNNFNCDAFVPSQTIQIIRVKGDGENKRRRAIAVLMFLRSELGQKMIKSISSGTLMEQIITKKLKELEIPHFNDTHITKLCNNFDAEIRLYKEISKIKEQIASLHSEFLEYRG